MLGEVRLGGTALPAYRLYRLDGAGKITSAEWLDSDSDDDAVRSARDLMDGAPSFELWDRERLVARVRNGSRQE